MKRILAIILAALMLCCVFVACDNESVEEPATTAAAKTEAPTEEEPTTEEETTTQEETTDDGQPDLVDIYIDVWEDKSQTPQAIGANYKGVGIRFNVAEGGYIYKVSVSAPSYSDDLGSLSIKLYAWDTDFDTTVSKEPLQVDEFVDFADNSTLVCEYEEGAFGGGTFLILVCDGVDELGQGVGVWMDSILKDDEEMDKHEITSIVNGKENKKKVGKFSLVLVEPEE